MNGVQLPLGLEEQLLGRPLRALLAAADRRAFSGQRILITGAGGSLGSELTRQIAACAPDRLVLLDHSEYAVFRIENELKARYPDLRVEVVLGDVTRRSDMRAVCASLRPHVVYHAAAYKHVAITERSAVPAIRTNVLGTLETALAAREAGARFVLISSDKAAEPRSVMGASKRLAEIVALSMASPTFRPIAVRFGNILGSSGSLIEILERCVREGRNVPLTHPDATRFFMTASEAVSLVLKADLIGCRAEVFWLDMGDPLRIGDLAERFIEYVTPSGQARVGIDVIGLRPGEKMREELTSQGLTTRSTSHPRIWSARQRRVAPQTVALAIRSLRRAVAGGDAEGALGAMESAVEDFSASAAAWTAARSSVVHRRGRRPGRLEGTPGPNRATRVRVPGPKSRTWPTPTNQSTPGCPTTIRPRSSPWDLSRAPRERG
jgi:FlaA1/EpsC-like NDP-sugar epimerase